MIQKDADQFNTKDKFLQAGLDAERQLAFYLKREFEDNPKIHVLNGIRLENNDDAAQIDHLIIHRYGMILVENKSVVGKIIINDRNEWSRQFDFLKGMPSPVKQGKRQAIFLKKYLNAFGPQVSKTLGFQRGYAKMPIDILVSISDSAVIQRQKGSDENVYKADQIPDNINEIIRNYHKEKGLISFSIRPYILSDQNIDEICRFLIHAHKPLQARSFDHHEPRIIENNVSKSVSKVPLYSPLANQGFCIHCCKKIKLGPKVPYCRECYYICGKNQDRPQEKYCHICGMPTKSTLNKPSCLSCYKSNKGKLDFFVPQPAHH